MKKFALILLLPIILSLTSCATTSSESGSTAMSSNTAAATNNYMIQPGDILIIGVWKEANLQGEVLVRPDGGINFPLVGDLHASGKSIDQLKKDLTEKLSKYVPDPVVSIAIKESAGNKIYVVGKVHRPGEIIANRNMDVMQALSVAGGLTPYAAENKIKILRRVNGVLETMQFRYSEVEKGEGLDQNIILKGGDVVVVP